MSANTNPSIPPVVSIELVIFQNKQLTRLVRRLKKEAFRFNSSGHLSGPLSLKESDSDHVLQSIIEELEEDRRSLGVRLDRCLATISVARMQGSSNFDTVPVQASIELVQAPSESKADSDALEAEVLRLRTALALQCTNSSSVDAYRSSRNFSEIHASWKIDFPSQMIPSELETRLEAIQLKMHLTEGTFLSQIEKMSEDLALRMHECRKYSAQVAELEEKLKGLPCVRSEPDTPSLSSGSEEPLKALQASNSRLQGQLRIKEEQCSRILSQHVQLQTRATGLGQEVDRLREACASLSELQSASQTHLQVLQARETAEAKLRLSYIEAANTESMARKEIQELLDMTTRRLLTFEDLDVRTNMAWTKLQEELRECLREKTDILRTSRLESSSLPRQTSGISLAQLELDELKSKIRCSLCLLRNKAVALAPCLHCFCRECVDEKMLAARNRKCPLCMQRFSDAEVREIHFLKD